MHDDLRTRTASDHDWEGIFAVDQQAFAFAPTEVQRSSVRAMIPDGNVIVATEQERVVGSTKHYEMAMTVPGGEVSEVAGFAWVSVAATHRRRGLLRRLLADHHRVLLDRGTEVAVLTASEGGIYSRFGYGPATTEVTVEVDRRFASLRDTAPVDKGSVRMAPADEERAALSRIYSEWARLRPGAIHRSPQWWALHQLEDAPLKSPDTSPLFCLIHEHGYALYRVTRTAGAAQALVEELIAASATAYASLWQVLLGLDLVEKVVAKTGTQDALPFLLTDPRAAVVRGQQDGLWVRLLNIPAALSRRSYQYDGELVFQVDDDFLGRGGVFSLTVSGGVGCCQASTAEPQLRLAVSALGSLYLGGHPASTLAAAGLIQGTPAAVEFLTSAFSSPDAPRHGTNF